MSGNTEPKFRGLAVAASIKWIRSTYGDALYRRALSKLSPEERAPLERILLGTGWYPIPSWDRFLEGCRAEVAAETGEDEDTFDRRMITEVGGPLVTTLYKFIFSLFSVPTTLQRGSTIIGRLYEPSRVEVLESRAGYFQVRYSGPPGLYRHLRRYYGLGIQHFINLAGGKDPEVRLVRDAPPGADDFLLEYVATYR